MTIEDGSKLHYSGEFLASKIADSSTDKYSYAININGAEIYWTVYPYELLGQKIINVRIKDNERNIVIDRLFWDAH